MGAPDENAGTLSAGRLAYGCTDLSAVWPHGGTGLGLVGQVFLFPQRRWAGLPFEETNSTGEVIWLGGDLVVSLTLEGWDEAAMAALNPNTATSSGRTIVEWPGSDYVAGAPVTPLQSVVFTPWDTTNGKGFVIYRAAGLPDLNQALAFSAYRFLEVPAVLVAVPGDSSDRLGKLSKFSDLTL